MLKGYKKIDKYLSNWCKEHGFKVKCRFSTDFEYEDGTNTVFYSLVVPEKHTDLFFDVCKELMPDIQACDNFIISFFHELGHYITQDDYTEDEWDDYYRLTEKLSSKKKLTNKDYLKYYYTQVEYDATVWGCNFINNNTELIKDFVAGLTPLVLNFYKVNKVELS